MLILHTIYVRLSKGIYCKGKIDAHHYYPKLEKIIDCGVVKYSKMNLSKFSVWCREIKMHPLITFMCSQVPKIC